MTPRTENRRLLGVLLAVFAAFIGAAVWHDNHPHGVMTTVAYVWEK